MANEVLEYTAPINRADLTSAFTPIVELVGAGVGQSALRLMVRLQPWPKSEFADRCQVQVRGRAEGGGTVAGLVGLQVTRDGLREFCETVLHQLEELS